MADYKNQHIIPQIYLKLFGFSRFFKSEIWFVSVKDLKENKWQDREIGKFLSENYIYTLENYKEIHELIIERDLNGAIETRIPIIIDQLESGLLDQNVQLGIAETAANFLARTKRCREWLKGWISREDFRDFFEIIIEFEGFNDAQKENIFNSYKEMSEKDAINSLMVTYMNHTSKQLKSASIEVLKSTRENPFFTTDNPVTLINDIGYGEIGRKEMEIYFPLSNTILIRFYWHNKGEPIQRSIKNISRVEYHNFHREVIPMSAQRFIISPIEKSILGK
ncbi:MAG TPA: DUF4238 domain-containing protein [Saprospiraceae bacterium]|nr:DUF4238 domain-containing protein [Saprospiraceae bacterium]